MANADFASFHHQSLAGNRRLRQDELSTLRVMLDLLKQEKFAELAVVLSERRDLLKKRLLEQKADDSVWKLLCNVYGADNARTMQWAEIDFLDLCIRLLKVEPLHK
jgi:hypothetical protein